MNYLDERFCVNCGKPVKQISNLQPGCRLGEWVHVREEQSSIGTDAKVWLNRRFCRVDMSWNEIMKVADGLIGLNEPVAEPNIVVSEEETEAYLNELAEFEHDLDDLPVD